MGNNGYCSELPISFCEIVTMGAMTVSQQFTVLELSPEVCTEGTQCTGAHLGRRSRMRPLGAPCPWGRTEHFPPHSRWEPGGPGAATNRHEERPGSR